MTIPVSGGTQQMLAPAAAAGAIAAAGDIDIYFSDSGTRMGIVAKVSVATKVVTILAEKQGTVGAIALDTTKVYWTSGKHVYKLPR
jgi:hypothetical protein